MMTGGCGLALGPGNGSENHPRRDEKLPVVRVFF